MTNPFREGSAEHDAWERQDRLVLGRVYDFLGRFVSYPTEHARIAHALWIVHTHVMEAWESTPRLAFLSPEPGSGKTRALEITELLVPRPVEAVNVTPAYLFRKVGDPDGAPTILFDEIDTVFGPKAKDNEEIRGLLNAGHRRGAVAGRCVVKGRTIETEEIAAYCAVALGGLGGLPDTLLSRAVVIRMRRRGPDERVEAYRRRVHEGGGHELRDAIAGWAGDRVKTLTEAWPNMPTGIEDRDADVWEPLLAIADEAGAGWPERARSAAVALVAESKESTPSLGVRLLADLQIVFGQAEAMSTESILSALRDLDEAPWGDLYGKALNARGLATRLRQYAVGSKNVRVDGKVMKGYRRDDLQDPWARYLRVADATDVTHPYAGVPSESNGHDSSFYVTQGIPPGGIEIRTNGGDGELVRASAPESATSVASATPVVGECCEGGPIRPKCGVCIVSPTFWRVAK